MHGSRGHGIFVSMSKAALDQRDCLQQNNTRPNNRHSETTPWHIKMHTRTHKTTTPTPSKKIFAECTETGKKVTKVTKSERLAVGEIGHFSRNFGQNNNLEPPTLFRQKNKQYQKQPGKLNQEETPLSIFLDIAFLALFLLFESLCTSFEEFCHKYILNKLRLVFILVTVFAWFLHV